MHDCGGDSGITANLKLSRGMLSVDYLVDGLSLQTRRCCAVRALVYDTLDEG